MWKKGFPMRDPPVRYREQKRAESLLWQCALPGYDYELWLEGAHWMVNPNTGHKLAEMRVNNPEFP